MSKFIQIIHAGQFEGAGFVDYGGLYALDDKGDVWFFSLSPQAERKWEKTEMHRVYQ